MCKYLVKRYRVWFVDDEGEEDYMVLSAHNIPDAIEKLVKGYWYRSVDGSMQCIQVNREKMTGVAEEY